MFGDFFQVSGIISGTSSTYHLQKRRMKRMRRAIYKLIATERFQHLPCGKSLWWNAWDTARHVENVTFQTQLKCRSSKRFWCCAQRLSYTNQGAQEQEETLNTGSTKGHAASWAGAQGFMPPS